MNTGGTASLQSPSGTGSVVGHSYTAAYRYQLVIGKVGGWAIPYPLTIPQAVTGLGSVVLAMLTASWWYPLTGIGGALGVVVLPFVGIRVISRIRPEGRSVSDWLYGWGMAQSQALLGQGVRLHLGPPGSGLAALPSSLDSAASSPAPVSLPVSSATSVSSAVAVPSPVSDLPLAPPVATRAKPKPVGRSGVVRQTPLGGLAGLFSRSTPKAARRSEAHSLDKAQFQGKAQPPVKIQHPDSAQELVKAQHPAGDLSPVVANHSREAASAHRAGRSHQVARLHQADGSHRAGRPPQATSPPKTKGVPKTRRAGTAPKALPQPRWQGLKQLFTTTAPTSEPERVPVFDPWAVTPAPGGIRR